MPKKEVTTIWIYNEASKGLVRVCVNHREVDRGCYAHCKDLADTIERAFDIVGVKCVIKEKEM